MEKKVHIMNAYLGKPQKNRSFLRGGVKGKGLATKKQHRFLKL